MDLSQATLTQMRYAVSVARFLHFREAAAYCHVSQSGLSMQLQKLEEILDVVLFDRSRKPVLITDEGQRLLSQMRAILKETERLGQLASEQEEPSGLFRLAVIPTLASTVVPLFLSSFIARFPQVELFIDELKTEDIVRALHTDELDAGILATPLHDSGLSETVVGIEDLYAYLPPFDPLLKKRALTQAELSARKLWVMPEGHCFRTQVLSYCRTDQQVPRGPVHFESGSFETLMQLVDDGLGATVIPALVAARLSKRKRDCQLRPLLSPRPAREIGLVRSRADFRKSVSDALTKVLTERLSCALGGPSPRREIIDPLARS